MVILKEFELESLIDALALSFNSSYVHTNKAFTEGPDPCSFPF